MRFYKAKIPAIAREVIETLRREGDIEVPDDKVNEAEADVAAILYEYLRMDREVTEAAKDALERRGLDHTHLGRVKRSIAKEKGFAIGEEALEYVLRQITEMLFYSANVEEVFSEDALLRKKMSEIFKKHLEVDEELDREVRKRIRNLEEGTESWDIEYNRVLTQLKRQRGLE
jgi:hypothetical protein